MPSLPIVLALRGVETLVNRALQYDPATRLRLRELSGKSIYVETESPRFSVMLRIQDERIRLLPESTERPHATIEAQTGALLKLALSRELQLIGGPLRVHGQVQLIEQLHGIAKQLDIDWEEPLSMLFGDSAAHEVCRHVRGLFGFAQKAAKTFLLNSREYLQEEREVLPVRWEIDEFVSDCDDLRADSERLEARLKRVQQRLSKLQGSTT